MPSRNPSEWEYNPLVPIRAYNKSVGSNPLVDTGIMAGGGSLLGYFGGGALLNKLFPDMDPKRLQSLKNLAGVAGFGLGTLYGTGRHADTSGDRSDFIKSMTDRDYWDTNPDAQARIAALSKKRIADAHYDSESSFAPKFTWGRSGEKREPRALTPSAIFSSALGKEGSDKEASSFDAFDGKLIPIRTTMNLIDDDPFLTLGDKQLTNRIIYGAENRDIGVTSGKNIMQSALKAGIGFGSAYVAAKGLGKVMGLPEDTVKKWSRGGELAGALYNSGFLHN